MNKLLFYFILFLPALSAIGQSGISYQAIVRNASGQVQANSEVFLKLSITPETSGTILYSEEINLRTDAYGWFNAVLGNGTNKTGDLSAIDWPGSVKLLLVDCKPSATGTYARLGSNVINPITLRGSQGLRGEAGAQGIQGVIGAPGLVGAKGEKGDAGIPGNQGAQGLKGDKGDAGTGVKIIGSVANATALNPSHTGAIGDMVIAQDNGNGHVWDGTRWNNVGQIKGPKGESGAQGIQGLQGLNGTNGSNGDAGAKGDKGDIGLQGIRGEQGIQGILGSPGLTGAKGDKGDTGPEGPRGMMGLQGVTGANGTNGATGTIGAKGDKGDPGDAGFAWSLNGNAGLNADSNYIGTSTDIDLVFRRNKIKSGLINSSNTALGNNSMRSTTGTNNSAFGRSGLQVNTTGVQNTAIGAVTLIENIDGSRNTAVGYNSMANNISGTNNVAIGNNSLSTSNNHSNTAVGSYTLTNHPSSFNNIAIGYGSMFNKRNGNSNISIGYESMWGNNGSNNIIIGNNAARSDSTDNKLFIENSDANKNNALIYGDFAADSLLLNAKTINRNSFHLKDRSFLELGYGLVKEENAGKIGYGLLTSDALDILGGGNSIDNRKIRFWNEGGAQFEGSATFNGGIRLSNFIGTPSAGYIRYNSGTNEFEGHNGTAWKVLSGGSTGTGASTLWGNSLLGANTIHNSATTNRILLAQTPGSVAITGNQVLTVAAETADKIASFITTNVTDDTKAVEIINQGSSAAFARPIALNIENMPHAQAGIGIKVKTGGTGIEINSNLVALRANGNIAGPGSVFTGGIGLTSTGQGTGIFSSAALAANNSTGVFGQYTGNGSFDGVGMEGIGLPSNATVPNGRGFGYGGKFTGGNKGVYVEMKDNPSSLYLTDLRTYTKFYGGEERPMAGLFKSAGSVGIMAIASDFHQNNPTNENYSIGIVGRSNATGTSVKNIGVYGEGEGVGERVGIMGYADSINTSLAIGVRGIAKGDFGMGGDFKAAEGIHIEATRVGLHVQAPFNEFSGASASPLLTLLRLAPTPGEVLNLNNGYIKVSGSNKTAFVHTSTASNITGNATILTYPGASSSDLIFVQKSLPYTGSSVLVWYDGFIGSWKIAHEINTLPMPVNARFNVLIIKQ